MDTSTLEHSRSRDEEAAAATKGKFYVPYCDDSEAEDQEHDVDYNSARGSVALLVNGSPPDLLSAPEPAVKNRGRGGGGGGGGGMISVHSAPFITSPPETQALLSPPSHEPHRRHSEMPTKRQAYSPHSQRPKRFEVINYGKNMNPLEIPPEPEPLSVPDGNNNTKAQNPSVPPTPPQTSPPASPQLQHPHYKPHHGAHHPNSHHLLPNKLKHPVIPRSVFDIRPGTPRQHRDRAVVIDVDQVNLKSVLQHETSDASLSITRLYKEHNLPIEAAIKYGRLYSTRKKARIIQKDGSINISYKNIDKKKRGYLIDIFTTMLELRWRYTLLLFAMGFLTTWFVFATIWCFIAWLHGDFEEFDGESSHVPCVDGVNDFWTALYFSVETQHTIGYGTRAVTTQCKYTSVILMMQSILGVMVQSILAGVVFAKLSRPKYRSQTMMFSKYAGLCIEDDQYYLMFRVGDMRRSLLIGATMEAMIVYKRVTAEGREIPFSPRSLEIHVESAEHDQYFAMSWPIRVVHRIDENSPFWTLKYEEILAEEFELLVFLEGTIESSSQTTQIRTSYLPSEIQWGHTLAPLLTYKNSDGQYEIDFSRFHDIDPVPMPHISAQAYDEQKRRMQRRLSIVK